MTLLFLSTIIITGPAWFSQLCYFGALDNLIAKGKTSKKAIQNKFKINNTIIFSILAVTLAPRLFNINSFTATFFGALFGIVGIIRIFTFSKKQHRMIHWSVYCPISSIVSYLQFINPFRMYIDSSCDSCSAYTTNYKYDALKIKNLD